MALTSKRNAVYSNVFRFNERRRVQKNEKNLSMKIEKLYGNAGEINTFTAAQLLKRSIGNGTFVNNPSTNAPTYGSGAAAPVHEESGTATPPSAGFNRLRACLRGVVVQVDASGNIIASATTGPSTTGLNYNDILKNAGLIPAVEGSHAFVFEFFGWRKKKNFDGGTNDAGWVSADDNYKIRKDFRNNLTYTVD